MQSSAEHHQKLCASISQLQEQQRDEIIYSGKYSTINSKSNQSYCRGGREKWTINCIVNNKQSK